MSPRLITFILTIAALQAQSTQQVEGCATIIPDPTPTSHPATKPIDHRGPSPGYMTRPWWTTDENSRLKWKTAAPPEKRTTVVAFTAGSSVIPAELTRGPRARLYYNGEPAVEFDIGQPRDRVWSQGDFELRYESRRAEWPWSAAHRQFFLNGDSGIYRLQAPAAKIVAGQAVTLELALLPFPPWPNGWFMVKQRPDTLTENDKSLTQQVRQLQRDVSRLGALTKVLATHP